MCLADLHKTVHDITGGVAGASGGRPTSMVRTRGMGLEEVDQRLQDTRQAMGLRGTFQNHDWCPSATFPAEFSGHIHPPQPDNKHGVTLSLEGLATIATCVSC